MNIVRVMGCPSFNYGSQEQYLINLGNELSKGKHQLHVIYENVPCAEFLRNARDVGITIHVINSLRIFPTFFKSSFIRNFLNFLYDIFDIKKIFALRKILIKYDIDIVHCYFSPSIYGAVCARLLGKKSVRTMGNPIIQSGLSQGKKDNFWFRCKCIVQDIFPTFLLDKQICISNLIRNEFIALGANSSKLHVINSGPDYNTFNPKFSYPKNFIEENKISKDDFVIGFTGRLEKQKNLFFLIEIFAQVSKQIPNAKLFLVGEGSLHSKINDEVNRNNLSKKIFLTGRRKNIQDILPCFNLFLLPSLFEGLPGSLMEAMSMGICSVASDIEVHREIINHNIDGFLCNLNYSKNFSSKIIELYNNRERMKEIGIEARKKVKSRFSIQKRSSETTKLYKNLLSK